MTAFSALLAVLLAIISTSAAAETQIDAPGPHGLLEGAMLSAGQGAPVVLMIPGSGPTDRDGNNPHGVKASTLRLLAQGLAAKGIATVRVDKRGMFSSAGAVSDPNAVTIADYVADVRSWTGSIRHKTGAKCVWVLGQSEGGLVALAAAQDSSDICGLVLVSTAGRTFGELLDEQLKSNPANAPVLDQAQAAVKELEAGHRVDASKLTPALLPLFHPAVQGFLISEMALDPAALIAKVREPVLILQGNRDIQVATEDAELLQRADPLAELVVLPDTNHVLKRVTSDDRLANVATYSDPDAPLAPGVISSIADFVDARDRHPG